MLWPCEQARLVSLERKDRVRERLSQEQAPATRHGHEAVLNHPTPVKLTDELSHRSVPEKTSRETALLSPANIAGPQNHEQIEML